MKVDMEHVVSGHTSTGKRAVQSKKAGKGKDLFYGMSYGEIEKVIIMAYRNGKRIKTQGKRAFVREKMTIEMWVNTKTKIIESAWPKV